MHVSGEIYIPSLSFIDRKELCDKPDKDEFGGKEEGCEEEYEEE